MIATFGYLTLVLAFLLALYGLIVVIFGLYQRSTAFIQSARSALMLIFPMVSISLIAMLILLLDDRFDVAYVYSVSSRSMPVYLKMTALWGGQSGSLLFWSWLLSGFSITFASRNWKKERDLLPWVLLVLTLVSAFFLFLNVFTEMPFERFWEFEDGSRVLSVLQPRGSISLMPIDGQGLNPLLRHPGMIWHPPALYLGFIGLVIPFAMAIAALAAGRKDQQWITISRSWILIAWVFLSLGLVLGMQWAYDVLGWGGYWGWDPVEIAALLPWLSATAFLHTALLQRRRDIFKRWNFFLVILTFSLVIFGTFLTRSGVISSVHAFGSSSVGPLLFGFTTIILIGGLGFLGYRWKNLQGTHFPEFTFSRELLTVFTNLILLSTLAVCVLGVIYPILSEWITGAPMTVGPEWYERITGPLFLLLLLLTGICPLAGWGLTYFSRLKRRLLIVIPLSLLVPLAVRLLTGVRGVVLFLSLWMASLGVLILLAQVGHDVKLVVTRFEDKILVALWRFFRRNRLRYGALLVHLGIVVMSLGIIGLEGLQQETQVTLKPRESALLNDYHFRFDGVENFEDDDGISVIQANLTVIRDGKLVTTLSPQRQIFAQMGLAVTQPSVDSNLARDLYAILVESQFSTQETVTFRFYVTPLVNWLWIGTAMLTLGTLIALLPHKRLKS